ncbi:MAG: trehalose-phosphatase [Candidatus Rokubacteria bacterium]|nr:trehalose-phosphatase [Candidatus Rokubacteria bacterium]
MSDRAAVLRAAMDALGSDGTLLLLADYDGTLTRIADDPRDAWLSKRVRDDLSTLAGTERVHVAVLSGRSVDDLQARIGVPGFIYAGCHGLEVEGPGISFRHPAAEARRPTMRDVAATLRRRLAAIPGAVIEAKDLAVTIHYGNVAPEMLERLELEIERTTRERTGLRLLGGRKVVELLPTLGWDKGECALWIRARLRTAGVSTLVTVYLGDDMTDEIAFAALPPDVISVRVGVGPTAARYQLDDVAAVEELIGGMTAALGEVRSCE